MGWEAIPITVDSGAVDNVTGRSTAPWIPIQETKASKSGLKYTVADGKTIPNRGQKNFKGLTTGGQPMNMGVQVTDVVKTLFSVRRIKEAGNIVIFGAAEGDMIVDKKGTFSRSAFYLTYLSGFII